MRRSRYGVLVVLMMAGCAVGSPGPGTVPIDSPSVTRSRISLVPPDTDGMTSLETALSARRSIRDFSPVALTPEEFGQLLWAAQGVTSSDGKRTAPSAGGLYPLEVYALTADGMFHYLPDGHEVEVLTDDDLRAALAEAALEQEWIAEAPAVFVIVGVEARTAAKYGDRATRYVALEAGHAAQNVLLQATALGLAPTVPSVAPHRITPDTWLIPNLPPPVPGLPAGQLDGDPRQEPIVVDTGRPHPHRQLVPQVFSLVDPEDIRWIYLSHDDGDHMGSLHRLLELAPTPRWW
jgi:SagB-type dehydrogenase family enzyme